MGFDQYKNSDWLQQTDLPEEGAVATITRAEYSMQKDFKSNKEAMKLTLHFAEFKPMTLTNKNLGYLTQCFPHKDGDSIGVERERIWLYPRVVDAYGEDKTVVRINPTRTIALQQGGGAVPPSADSAGQGATAGESRDADVPPAGDDDIPF